MNEQATFLYGRASRLVVIITAVVLLLIVIGIAALPYYAGFAPDIQAERNGGNDRHDAGVRDAPAPSPPPPQS